MILYTIFARPCVICNQLLIRYREHKFGICHICLSHLNYEYKKVQRTAQRTIKAHSAISTIFYYENYAQKLIYSLKFYKHHTICLYCAYMLHHYLKSHGFIATHTGLIPAGISRKSLYTRGLSIPYYITYIMHKRYHYKLYPLLYLKKGISQKLLSLQQRIQIRPQLIQVRVYNKPISSSLVIIDDVSASGTTLTSSYNHIQSLYADKTITLLSVAATPLSHD